MSTYRVFIQYVNDSGQIDSYVPPNRFVLSHNLGTDSVRLAMLCGWVRDITVGEKCEFGVVVGGGIEKI